MMSSERLELEIDLLEKKKRALESDLRYKEYQHKSGMACDEGMSDDSVTILVLGELGRDRDRLDVEIAEKRMQLYDLQAGPPAGTQSIPVVQPSPPTVPESPLMCFIAEDASWRRNATEKFLHILGFAFQEDPAKFEKLLEISGRRRKYFGRSKEDIEQSGRNPHPRPIYGSGYWAMTNADTRLKRDILRRALEVLGYSPDEIRTAVQALERSR